MATGGPLLDMTITHELVGSRLFTVAGDADVSTDLGGYSQAVESNGDLSARNILTPKPWMLENVSVVVDDTRGDLEYLQSVADSPINAVITVTYLSGVVRQGTGTITGDIKSSTQSATASISLSGGGRLTPQ